MRGEEGSEKERRRNRRKCGGGKEGIHYREADEREGRIVESMFRGGKKMH